jgi:phospholipid/cholesterol/gamma-HCH transport system substrate-binding protein
VQTQNIKVGIFVVGLSLTILVSVFILGGSSDLLEGRYELKGQWEDVAGLKEGAVVRLAGWDVGEVQEIDFSEDLTRSELTVEMKILDRYQDRIRSDSVARIDTVGVLGDKYVSISMGTPSADDLVDGAFIKTQPPLDFLGYTNKFEDILANTVNITKKFDLMLGTEEDAAEAELGKSVGHLKGLFKGIRDGKGMINALVHDEGIANNFRSTMRNVSSTSAGMADLVKEVRTGDGLANELIYGGEDGLAQQLKALTSSLAQLTQDIRSEDSMIHALIYDGDKAKILDDLGETMASLKKTSAALENGEGTLGLLAHDPALYEDLRALVGGAQRNKLLRAYIRRTIEKGEQVNASSWSSEED